MKQHYFVRCKKSKLVIFSCGNKGKALEVCNGMNRLKGDYELVTKEELKNGQDN